MEFQSFAHEAPPCMYYGCAKQPDGTWKGGRLIDDPQELYTQGYVSLGQDVKVLQTYLPVGMRQMAALVRENMHRIQNAKRRLGLTVPKVIWQFLAFRHNEHEIEEARAVHRAWGADEIAIVPAIMPLAEYNDGLSPSTIARWNMYDPSHPVQRETARHMKAGKPCSWW